MECQYRNSREECKGEIVIMLTMEDATKEFLSSTNMKESTFSQYSFICERYILPYFKNTEIRKLSNGSINSFIQEKINNGGLLGKPLSPKTINDMAGLLVQIIKGHSQFEIDIAKPRYRSEEITIFTKDEYNKLKAYMSLDTDNRKLGIIIALLTGIRLGELCALTWESIDLDRGIIFINKTMQRIKSLGTKAKTKIIIDTPKSTASVRAIPIPVILLDLLRMFKSDDSFYVLTNTKKYIEPRVYQRHFKRFLEACSIRDYKFHTLRHTFATNAITSGMDLKTLSMLLGHTDVSFTMKRYVHPNMEHRRTQIEKLAVGF